MDGSTSKTAGSVEACGLENIMVSQGSFENILNTFLYVFILRSNLDNNEQVSAADLW